MDNVLQNKHYVLACSGGPDSMALFHMLLNKKISFSVALVNYHKRDVSNDEEKMVEKYCIKHKIQFYHADAIKNTNENFQSWARKFRYDFFVDIVKKEKADGILVAHHLDDLLETYLFQKKRKGIYSFYGINSLTFYKDIPVIRPLLKYRKKELLIYCVNNNVPYSIDESNLKNDYTRNKIRHQIVEKLTPVEIEKLLVEIETINKKNKEEEKIVEEYLYKTNTYKLIQFKTYSYNVQKKIIYKIMLKHHKKCTGREIDNIISFLLSDNSNAVYTIKQPMLRIYKNYGFWEVKNIKELDYIYKIYEKTIFESDLVYFNMNGFEDKFFIKNDSYPLTITNVKKDEYVKIGNLNKKVNRLFIDEKIPLKYRDIWPCIKDVNGKIIFFPRKQKIIDEEKRTLIFELKDWSDLNE